MKKFAVLFAVVVLFAFTAPAFSATNPFMDVPMNSWAYDAVAQLASKGILSGYPDGLYKGRQPMTRYEAASAIARALAYVDMTKASKQDVDMLKRLIVEFKDELDALGMRVDALEKDMGVFKKRLSGWRMSGHIRFDADYRSRSDSLTPVGQSTSGGNMGISDGRINIDRFFGEDEKAFFRMRLRYRTDAGGWDSAPGGSSVFERGHFYVTIPFIYDSRLTVGWAGDDDIDKYFGFYPDMTGRYADGYGWFNDNQKYLMKFTKGFEFGDVYLSIAHPNDGDNGSLSPVGHAWEVTANINFKWNEQFKLGIGGQYLSQDDWFNDAAGWDSVFTAWLGVTFNFIPGAALHGQIYFQSQNGDPGWDESANAWRLAFDINQDVLKFTSFYAEYGRIQQYFWTAQGHGYNGMFLFTDRDAYRGGSAHSSIGGMNIMADDISYWKVGAIQQWTEKTRTWLYYGSATGSDAGGNDAGLRQYAIGIDYAYNPYTIFSLNYLKFEGTDNYDDRDYSRIRFSTTVNF
jgi:hypothetical protein